MSHLQFPQEFCIRLPRYAIIQIGDHTMRSICLSLAFILFAGAAAGNCANHNVDGGFVMVKGKRFQAEVARTDLEHAKGLMYRTGLKSDRCMFFVYEHDGHHSIWMKNCYIALDVAWIDAEGIVVEIVENAPPCPPLFGDDCPSYGGNKLSRHFIEFPAGTVRRIGLAVGDHIRWELQFSDGRTFDGGLPPQERVPTTRPPSDRAKADK
jgi:uncharacterized membrane protein (UPF0127 family)